MNQRDWVKLLTPTEKKVLGFALADQDRLIDREGEQKYYENVTELTAQIVEFETVRQEIIEELTL